MTRHFRIWSKRLAVAVSSLALLAMGLPVPAGAVVLDTVTYTADTPLVLSGVPVTLTILNGSSHGDSLSVGSTSFTLPTTIVGTFTVRYTGPSPKSFTDGTATYCTYTGGNNDFAFTSTHVGKTISISATECTAPPSGGGGGGGYITPTLTVITPNGGESYETGETKQMLWSAGGSQIASIRAYLSTDGGSTFPTTIFTGEYNDSIADWTVPDVNTTTARVKVESVNTYGSVAASDVSDADFTIVGTPPSSTEGEATMEPQQTSEPPATDDTQTGSYTPSRATENTPDIDTDKGLKEPQDGATAPCVGGTLIKGPTSSAVYYCGKDGKRYVFPNEHIFYSWFTDFSSLTDLTAAQLAAIPLGGNVTYRPGIRMIKIQSDPKVYAVSRDGHLRWVANQAVARALYGADWNTKIDDVGVAFFFSYRIGSSIGETCPADDLNLDVTSPCFSENTAVAIGTKG